MKITFICGSLEPGRDGVGDYTRMLAVQLIKGGHGVSAIALNDRYVSDKCEDTQSLDETCLSVYRIPSSWSSSRRINQVQTWVAEINPDWLSLQFVLFSFHSKGLPLGLSKQLKLLGSGKRWHVMFHELWVGMRKGSSFMHTLWGNIQKLIIKSMIYDLQPLAVHTQAKLYQLQLEKIGIDVKYLPLFSNIPVVQTCSGNGKNEFPGPTKKTLTLVLFGTIHRGAPIQTFAVEASLYAKENDVQVVLVLVGNCGIEQDRWSGIWKSVGLEVRFFGEQSAEKISEILSSCTFGISTTPIALAEKSGTIAAMLGHGLPVLCIREPWESNGIDELPCPSGITSYRKGCLKNFFENKIRIVPNTAVSTIGRKFAEDLLQAKAH